MDVLLDYNANVSAKNVDGNTALHLSLCFNKAAAAETILNKLSSATSNKVVNAQNNKNQTALHLASQYGNIDVLKILLIRDNVDFFQEDAEGNTILHYAVLGNNIDAVDFTASRVEKMYRWMTKLTNRFGDAKSILMKRTASGETALHTAIKIKSGECVVRLLKCFQRLARHTNFEKALSIQDATGNTVAHLAIAKKRSDILKLFLMKARARCNWRKIRKQIKGLDDNEAVDDDKPDWLYNIKNNDGHNVLDLVEVTKLQCS